MKKKRMILVSFLVAAATLLIVACGSRGTAMETKEPETTTETDAITAAETVKKEEIGKDTITKDMEAFAEQIQEAVSDKDMESMAELLLYPCDIETTDKESIIVKTRRDFLKLNPDQVFGDDLMIVIANVDTAALKVTEAGVVMGDETPNIIFDADSEGRLGIKGINE